MVFDFEQLFLHHPLFATFYIFYIFFALFNVLSFRMSMKHLLSIYILVDGSGSPERIETFGISLR